MGTAAWVKSIKELHNWVLLSYIQALIYLKETLQSEQDCWGAVEALTVPPTENKGLCRAGTDLRVQMLQME